MEMGASGKGVDEFAGDAGVDGDDAGGGGRGHEPIQRSATVDELLWVDAERTFQRGQTGAGRHHQMRQRALPACADGSGLALPVEADGERSDAKATGKAEQGGLPDRLESAATIAQTVQKIGANLAAQPVLPRRKAHWQRPSTSLPIRSAIRGGMFPAEKPGPSHWKEPTSKTNRKPTPRGVEKTPLKSTAASFNPGMQITRSEAPNPSSLRVIYIPLDVRRTVHIV